MPTTSELLLRWDAQRERTLQTAIGWSEVGGCRRRAGYRLAGTPSTSPSSSVQAVMGTAVHDAIRDVSQQLGMGTEQEIEFAGIRGHFDRREGTEVVDTKTVGTDRFLEQLELHGPPQAHRFQVHGYAAGCITAGVEVRTVRIDYLARDTGREWAWRSRFDPAVVREALAWLKQVRDTELEMLPRDYLPDSAFCGHCPFAEVCWQGAVPDRNRLSAIYVDDPDTAGFAAELFELRAQIKELKAREQQLTGILDAVRPETGGVVDTGEHLLRFQPTGRGGWALHFAGRSKVTR